MTQPMIPPLEERQYRRIPIGYQVKVVAEDRIIVYSKAINLSLGGILVSGRDQLPVGSHCGVAILLVDGEPGRRVVARGTVVRTDQQGMAIAFSRALDPESEASLRVAHPLAVAWGRGCPRHPTRKEDWVPRGNPRTWCGRTGIRNPRWPA